MAVARSLKVLAIGGVGVVAVVAIASLFLVAPRKVTMTYVGGEDCVTLAPTLPEIWQDAAGNGLKKKKVKWVATSSQKGKYYWEIIYEPGGGGGKPVGSGDFLGAIPPIKCGKKSTKSPKTVADQGQTVDWPYKITVSACDAGSQGDELCVMDPVVRIRR